MVVTAFIYSLSDPKTQEIRYIGKANDVKERFKHHMCVNKKGQSISKCWIKGLRSEGLKPIVDVIDEIPHKEWEFWEQYYISLYKSWGFRLTNMQIGGRSGQDGVKFSDETKEKMRLAQLGKRHTSEAKEKQRLKQLGVVPSLKTREKLRVANIGKKMSPEAIAKTVARKEKPIVQFDLITGEKIAEHQSARKAMKALGGKGFNLTNHLKGGRKSYMGYRFEYKNKE